MQIKIKKEAMDKIKYFVAKSSVEISGLGKVEIINGEFIVTHVVLCEQVNTAATTDMKEEDIGKVMSEMRGINGAVTFWWHSHVNMGSNMSGTDWATIKDFGKNGYLIATVINKRHEMQTVYYQGNIQGAPSLCIDNVNLVVDEVRDDALTKAWDAEYDAKVKAPVYAYGNGGYYGKNYYTNNTKFCHKTRQWIADDDAVGKNLPRQGNNTGTQSGTGNLILRDGRLIQVNMLKRYAKQFKQEMGRKHLGLQELKDYIEAIFNMLTTEETKSESNNTTATL